MGHFFIWVHSPLPGLFSSGSVWLVQPVKLSVSLETRGGFHPRAVWSTSAVVACTR
jgi:hypothetical protein